MKRRRRRIKKNKMGGTFRTRSRRKNNILVGKPEGNRLLRRRDDNIKADLKRRARGRGLG